MSEHSLSPFFWPEPGEAAWTPAPPWQELFGFESTARSLIGVIWGMDNDGLDALEAALGEGSHAKLVIAVYPASPTDQGVMERLLQFCRSSNGGVEAAVLTRSLHSNAAALTTLLVLDGTSSARLWTGNTPNLAHSA